MPGKIITMIRTPAGTESKVCERCNLEKDIINFHPYWYQPKRGGKPFGERVRRRTNCCLDCRVKTFEPPVIRYFKETSMKDKLSHDKEWDSVQDRMLILQEDLDEKHFIETLKYKGETHDLVGIRFPSSKFILESKILRQMKEGKPIGTSKWLPKEIWIYSVTDS